MTARPILVPHRALGSDLHPMGTLFPAKNWLGDGMHIVFPEQEDDSDFLDVTRFLYNTLASVACAYHY